ncbi:hypothetical protein CRYUN_Cryun10bG0060400 [Craigia yunnanensis]
MDEILDTSVEDFEATNTTSKAKYHQKSKVWNHFTRIAPEGGSKSLKATRNHYGKEYATKTLNGISTLRKHLVKCLAHPNIEDLEYDLLHPQSHQDTNIVGFDKFDQEACRIALAKMIVIDELLFKFIEHEGFREFMSVAQPKLKMVSHTTVSKDCYRVFVHERIKLNKLFSTLGKYIGKLVETCLFNWGLENVGTITVDNATTNDVAISHLKDKKNRSFLFCGEFFYVMCSAHILNLIVKDGLGEVRASLARIRGAVKYVRRNKFKLCVEKEIIVCKSSVCLDVQTRWNSTYFMLDSALKFQKAFEKLKEDNSEFVTNLDNGAPTSEDWSKAHVIVKFLRIFYEATRKLSVLDPHYKVKYASFCFIKAYPNDSEKVHKLNALILKVMTRLFDYYKKIDSSSPRVITCLQDSMEMKFNQPIREYLEDMGTIDDE